MFPKLDVCKRTGPSGQNDEIKHKGKGAGKGEVFFHSRILKRKAVQHERSECMKWPLEAGIRILHNLQQQLLSRIEVALMQSLNIAATAVADVVTGEQSEHKRYRRLPFCRIKA